MSFSHTTTIGLLFAALGVLFFGLAVRRASKDVSLQTNKQPDPAVTYELLGYAAAPFWISTAALLLQGGKLVNSSPTATSFLLAAGFTCMLATLAVAAVHRAFRALHPATVHQNQQKWARRNSRKI